MKSFSLAQTLQPAMLQGLILGRWIEELDNWTKDFNSSLHPTMMDSHEYSAFLYIPYADAQFLNDDDDDDDDDAASVLEYESVSTRVLVGLGRPDPWSLMTLVVIEARGRLHCLT